MDNQKPSQLYYAFDGDSIGRRHAAAVLSDDVDNISNVSSEITHANEMVRDFVESNGGQMVSFGGDEGIFSAPAEFIELLEQLRKDYQYMVGATLSIGYGSKPSEAGKALLAAKNRGKDQVVQYDETAEQDAQKTQESRNQEVGKEESESEVGEVGLKQSNVEQQSDETNDREGQPHQESQGGYANEVASDGITRDDPPVYDNNHQYDSGYKNSSKETRGQAYREEDLTPPVIAKPNLTPKPPVAEATSGDVPESNRRMNNVPANPGEQEPEDKKPDSKYYHGQAEYAQPREDGAPQSMADATNENRPSDLKYMRHGQQEPQADMAQEDSTTDVAENAMAQDMGTEGTQQPTPVEEDAVQHCPSCTCGAHGEGAKPEQSMDQVMDQHIENASDYTNTIGEGGDGGNQGSADPGESIEDILDQHLDNAADMAQNGDVNAEGMDPNGISRPEDYNAKQGDLGLSEEDNEEPQLDEVLRDGLDQHADGIQREKVVNMVGEALDAFKGQKKILDKAKEQAPELHSACISLLKALIELCSLAGIDESQAEQDVNEIEGGDVPEEAPGSQEMSQDGSSSESEEPCPNCGHPKEAAPQEGQQEAPQR
jgi:hypothetical protein